MSSHIESWIRENLPCVRTTSAAHYDRMPLQSGGSLVEIYQQPDATKVGHWVDTALCAAFVEAVGAPGGTVLDIGPGDGWPSLTIAPAFRRVTGVDPSPVRVQVQAGNAARMGRSNCEFVQMDVNRLQFPDAIFDGVVAASSIEQSPDPAQGLREIYRVLKPGGTLAMTFENYDHYGPAGETSEEIAVDGSGGERRLVYRHCTRTPPREAEYVLRLPADLGERAPGLARALDAIQRAGAAWLENHDLFEILAGLRDLGAGCEYYELSHLTAASLDRLLREAGYVDIRGFRDIGGLVPFVRTALERKRMRAVCGRLHGDEPALRRHLRAQCHSRRGRFHHRPEAIGGSLVNRRHRPMAPDECVFCTRRDQPALLFETRSLYVMPDKYPTVPGHVLIITREHLRCYALATQGVLDELEEAAGRVRRVSRRGVREAGFCAGERHRRPERLPCPSAPLSFGHRGATVRCPGAPGCDPGRRLVGGAGVLQATRGISLSRF